MNLEFFKYQGTGNDFVLIDNRNQLFNKNDNKHINKLCDRKFGIGADGLILLEKSNKYDFKMIYYNADGNESSMCGNGGRCIVAFANKLNIIKNKTTFEAIDGLHYAEITDSKISLQMTNVDSVSEVGNDLFLNTGSPHHVTFTENVNKINIKEKGSAIRYGKIYKDKGGANINFVEQINNNTFKVRTYERGVEDETLSCGTGVTAVAIAAFELKKTNSNNISLQTEGGLLEVSFNTNNDRYNAIFLKGPATFVFKGKI